MREFTEGIRTDGSDKRWWDFKYVTLYSCNAHMSVLSNGGFPGPCLVGFAWPWAELALTLSLVTSNARWRILVMPGHLRFERIVSDAVSVSDGLPHGLLRCVDRGCAYIEALVPAFRTNERERSR